MRFVRHARVTLGHQLNVNLSQEPSFPCRASNSCKMWREFFLGWVSLFEIIPPRLLNLYHFLLEGCYLGNSDHLMI